MQNLSVKSCHNLFFIIDTYTERDMNIIQELSKFKIVNIVVIHNLKNIYYVKDLCKYRD